MFTIMICLEQDSLTQRVNCIIENYYFYSTYDDWRCVNIINVRFYTLVLKYKDLI